MKRKKAKNCMHKDALTCGDRAVGGWVKSLEWAADRKPCALLTD